MKKEGVKMGFLDKDGNYISQFIEEELKEQEVKEEEEIKSELVESSECLEERAGEVDSSLLKAMKNKGLVDIFTTMMHYLYKSGVDNVMDKSIVNKLQKHYPDDPDMFRR